MVWLHGGAFSYGSANSPRYDSTRLARRNDVVVVAVNHRLNIFGHLDLSQVGGERFAQSGNAGVLDLVAALEWVREHAGALRRRSGQRHDLRPVRRRREGERAAGHAARQGPVPQGDHPERRQRALRRARAHDAAGRRRAEASRPAARPARRAAGAAAGAPAGGGRAGAGDAAAPAPAAARPLQFRAGDRRQRAARPAFRSWRAGAVRRHPADDRRHQGRSRRSFSRPTTRCGTARITEDELRQAHRQGRRRRRRRACSPTTSGAIRRRARPTG